MVFIPDLANAKTEDGIARITKMNDEVIEGFKEVEVNGHKIISYLKLDKVDGHHTAKIENIDDAGRVIITDYKVNIDYAMRDLFIETFTNIDTGEVIHYNTNEFTPSWVWAIPIGIAVTAEKLDALLLAGTAFAYKDTIFVKGVRVTRTLEQKSKENSKEKKPKYHFQAIIKEG